MFLLQLLVGFVGLLLFIAFIAWLVVYSGQAAETNETIRQAFASMTEGNFSGLLGIPTWYWKSIGLAALGLSLISSFILTPFSSASLVLTVGDVEKKQTFGQILVKSFKFIPAVILLLFITFLINMGAIWFFVLPGIVTSIFLGFSIYEMILEKKGVMEALRSSAHLVKNDFWLVVGRSLLLMVIYFVIFSIMPMFLSSIDSTLGSLYQVISMIPSFLSGYFAIAFTYAIYLHLKKTGPKTASAGIWWMVLLSAAGWLLAAGTIMGIYQLAKSPEVQAAFKQGWQSVMQEATSSAQMDSDYYYDDDLDYDYQPAEDQPAFLPKQPTVYPTLKLKAQPTCTNYNIREGEFTSNKCYSQDDYDDLFYYLGRFQTAQSRLRGAEATIEITCNGSDFFKKSCEDAQADKTAAEADISNYRSTIQEIISRGK